MIKRIKRIFPLPEGAFIKKANPFNSFNRSTGTCYKKHIALR